MPGKMWGWIYVELGAIGFVSAAASGKGGTVLRIPVTREPVRVYGELRATVEVLDPATPGATPAVEGVDFTIVEKTLVWGVEGPYVFGPYKEGLTGPRYLEILLQNTVVQAKAFRLRFPFATLVWDTGRAWSYGVLVRAGAGEIEVTIQPAQTTAGRIGFAVRELVSPENRTVDVEVRRYDGSAGPVSVTYQTEDDTAIAPGDYTHQTGTLNWADGDTAPKTIALTLGDVSANKQFRVRLLTATGGATLTDELNPLTVRIRDVPVAAGDLAFELTAIQVAEATTLTVKVRRVNGKTGAVGVSYASANGTAVAPTHFTAVSSTLSWADGVDDDKTFNVTIGNVTELRQFTLALSSPTGGAGLLAGYDIAVVQILDAAQVPPAQTGEQIENATQYMHRYDESLEDGHPRLQPISLAIFGVTIKSGVMGWGGAVSSNGGGSDLSDGAAPFSGLTAKKKHRFTEAACSGMLL